MCDYIDRCLNQLRRGGCQGDGVKVLSLQQCDFSRCDTDLHSFSHCNAMFNDRPTTDNESRNSCYQGATA